MPVLDLIRIHLEKRLIMDIQKITGLLEDIVGEKRVTDKDFDIVAYSRDLSPAKQKMATHIVMPESSEEIQQILKIANEHDVPIYLRGGGTSHWDAFLAQEPGIMLDLALMNEIIEIDERDLTVTVQPNCTWAKLDAALQEIGLTYLCSEAGGPAMTIGGSVMKAGGGPRGTAKFGFHGHRDIVTLEMVLPNGDIVHTGSAAWPSAGKFKRQCLGPDLAGMFIGAEGILGVCTELTLRIRPSSDYEERIMAVMPTLDEVIELGHFVNRLVGDEYLQGFYLWVEPTAPETFVVMADIFAYEKKIMDLRKKKLIAKIEDLGGEIGDPAPANDYFDRILTGLTDIFAAGVWHFFGSGSCRIDDIGFLYNIWKQELIEKRGYTKAGFGGQVLPRDWLAFMVTNYQEPEEWDELVEMADDINEMVLEGPVVPYGIGGRDGLRPFVAERDTGYYRLLKTLKKTLDPNNILQRGIFISEEELQ
ncbi:FAD-binding oxidoreductase [Candidatus Thorarchaeota archaeon]|nr:MAG: FAD-binding oxidoreductase [Candidatus Thorarchaeota archaeon]